MCVCVLIFMLVTRVSCAKVAQLIENLRCRLGCWLI